ncbi:M15 family metallopeptidase [uncultured Polaribacter sp.]|uniref:M15 family metallopeptidase n=1 Tax=uncultured Polaribacter sp. TaxID=174711 RepID=UPI00260EAE89|nr:M15 family metallopeptidase [uncultured Polaribacter sp.]
MKNLIFLFAFFFSLSAFNQSLPNKFVFLSDVDDTILYELKYFSNHNFIGKKIDGYLTNKVILTNETALALKKVQQILLKKNLSLKIFDAYRPQQSVNHFVKWAKEIDDTKMKNEFYPDVPKSELFKRGYIASKSGHSRGSTVDLTIVNLKTGKELDMGSPFDFFGIQSHPFYKNIGILQKRNRKYLRKIMIENGFKPYDNEWWHFTLKNEPFPNTYFNFLIK